MEVESYLTHLNSVHNNIKFTCEIESNNSLAFLDVEVGRRPNGTLSHTVYRKPTHTDRYLHGTSHHHPKHLASVATSLTNRAYDICDDEHVTQELEHVYSVLRRNGYTPKPGRRPHKNNSTISTVERQSAFLPYVKGVTDKIGRILNRKFNINTVFTPFKKVAAFLRSPKDRIPYQCPGVYKVDCSCGSCYIGQTKRSISQRIKEHIAAIRKNEGKKSAVAEHLLDSGTNHWIELCSPQVIATERHYIPRLVREAIEIKKHPKNFNREDGFKLAQTWNPVVSLCKSEKVKSVERQDVVSVVCRNMVNKTQKRTRRKVDRLMY